MKVLVLCFLTVLVRAFEHEEECNVTLPWLVERGSHPDLTDDQFSRLLQCPENLSGCSDTPPFCSWNRYLWTCSCADNCAVYGDCCWEKPLTPLDSKPISSCIYVNIENEFYKNMYAVTGCRKSWPQDEVRNGCENPSMYNDTFYETPVTSAKGVTYYNGFCALCNYDMEDVTFWNVSCKTNRQGKCSGRRRSVQVTLPDVVLDDYNTYLRPCDEDTDFVDTCNSTVSTDVVQRCETYFAPVQSSTDHSDTIYKNVYCALCNGEDLSTMGCSPVQEVYNWSAIPHLRTSFRGPNLVQLLRPVSSRDNCLFWQGDKCFIPKVEYRYNNDSAGVSNGSDVNVTLSVEQVSAKQDIQIYFTIMCLTLSLLCLALKAIVYAVFKSSRGFSSKCTLCLSCTLFWSHFLFLLANSLPLPRIPCMISAMFLHFGFLAAFLWTTVLSFDIWKGVAAVKLSRGRREACLQYSLIAWGLPLCLVLICAAIDHAAPSFFLAPQYGQGACWISSVKAHAVFFLTPMVLLLILNVVLYVHIVIHVRKTSKQTAGFDFRGGGQKSHMGLYVKLAFIMGATWILGFGCVYVESVITDVIFIMLVGLQGVYLFFGFKDYRYFIDDVRRRKNLQRGMSNSTNVTSAELSSVERNPKGERRTSE
ncbi:G-protein coupled receptor Mth2-like [Ornithodoros turicata]|uniref:G-protein coupled receptor Mth2-like n=1 Tax=Ornithodoros turicata TaxID=34597 RepID=UPI003139E94D